MNDKSRSLLDIILGNAFFLTLATGIIYIIGYSYWEGFYAHFGIPVRMIEISNEQFLLYGSAKSWIPLFIISIIISFLYAIIFLSKNKLKKDSDHLPKIFYITAFLPIILLVLLLIVLIFYSSGAEEGSKYALCNAPLVEVVYKDETAKVKKKQLGLLTISKGAYFFFELVHKAEETPNVIILQKESLVSVTTIGKVKTETKMEDCKPPQTTNKTKLCC